MKKLSVLALVLMSFQAQAWFNLNANCYIQGGVQAQCEVCNFISYRPIRCVMNVRGVSSYGAHMTAQLNGIIQPGVCANGYVRANNPYIDPLVHATAVVRCQ